MRFKIFLEDMNEEVLERIRWALRHDLANEIMETAIQSGVKQRVAEEEIINDYLNRHNLGWPVEL